MKTQVENLPLYGAYVLILGLFVSPMLISLGGSILLVGSVLTWKNKEIKLLINPSSLLLILFFLLSLCSFFYSSNHVMYLNKITVKIPYILLPLVFLNNKLLSSDNLRKVLIFFSVAAFIVGSISFGNYLIHFKEINAEILHSKPIPILFDRINHIYFSVILAFSVWVSLFLWQTEKGEYKVVYLFVFLGGLVFLHTICSRTGLAAFYFSCLAAIIWLMYEKRKVILGMATSISIGVIAILSIIFIPSLHNRFENTIEDIKKISNNENPNYYSIAMRVEAIKVSWLIFKNNPLLGVGEGDLDDVIQSEYTAKNSILTEENRKLPHNQFIQTMCTIGIVGFVVLLILFIMPFYKQNMRKNFLFLMFLMTIFISCQVESVLERQVGINFFCFFYLLFSTETKS